MFKFFTATFAIFLVSACSSKYQRASTYYSEGFVDHRLGKNIYQITYNGNVFTNIETAIAYSLLRCCEITIENDYKYFRVTQKKDGLTSYLRQSPNVMTVVGSMPVVLKGAYVEETPKVVSENVIVCYKTLPNSNDVFYDAFDLKVSIKQKYNLF